MRFPLVIVVLILLSVVSSSCDTTVPDIEVIDARTPQLPENGANRFKLIEFQRNRELWSRQGVESYNMIIEADQPLMYSPQPIQIEVRKSKVNSIKPPDNKKHIYLENYKHIDTIEKLFALIEEETIRKSDFFYVEYDAELGYPTRIVLDGTRKINDDELSVKILTLEIIK